MGGWGEAAVAAAAAAPRRPPPPQLPAGLGPRPLRRRSLCRRHAPAARLTPAPVALARQDRKDEVVETPTMLHIMGQVGGGTGRRLLCQLTYAGRPPPVDCSPPSPPCRAPPCCSALALSRMGLRSWRSERRAGAQVAAAAAASYAQLPLVARPSSARLPRPRPLATRP